MRVQRNLFTGNMSSSDSEFHEPKEKGKTGDTIKVRQQQTRMSPLEREIMIEWLGMEREGQKEGQSMKNWRSIWGGAAKGRNMQGEVDEVHSSSGYSKLAAYVNTKCQIKTDKEGLECRDCGEEMGVDEEAVQEGSKNEQATQHALRR